MAFIPGYDATITIVSDDISAVGTATNLTKSFNKLQRNVFGNAYTSVGAGQYTVSFDFEGIVDSTIAGTIEGHVAGAAVAFTIDVGDSGGTSAGTWGGNCLIDNLQMRAQVDGDWMVSFSAESTGAVTFS